MNRLAYWAGLYKRYLDTTPFNALYGYVALDYADLAFGDSRAPKAKDWIQDIWDILKILKENLQFITFTSCYHIYSSWATIFYFSDIVHFSARSLTYEMLR